MIYDISLLLSPSLAVWPGDVPLSRELTSDQSAGDVTTGSALHATAHLGTHADAPCHYVPYGAGIDRRDLQLYVGPCQVMHVRATRAHALTPRDLPGEVIEPRLLVATGTRPDPHVFNEDFAALSPQLVDHLHDQGVRLVGIDTPSVDVYAAKDLPAHQRFGVHDMAILEGLDLAAVPDGRYELIALPLRLTDFDGSPVRAILRTLNQP